MMDQQVNHGAIESGDYEPFGMNLTELLTLLEDDNDDCDDYFDEVLNAEGNVTSNKMNVQPLFSNDRAIVVPSVFPEPGRQQQHQLRHVNSSAVPRPALGNIQPQAAASMMNKRDSKVVHKKKSGYSGTKTLYFSPAGGGGRRGGNAIFRDISRQCHLRKDDAKSKASPSIKMTKTFIPNAATHTRCYNGFPSVRLERVSALSSVGASNCSSTFKEVQNKCVLCGMMTKYFCFGCKRHMCLTSNQSELLRMPSSDAGSTSMNADEDSDIVRQHQHSNPRPKVTDSHGLENYCGTFRTIGSEAGITVLDQSGDGDNTGRNAQRSAGAVMYFGVNSCYHELHYHHGRNERSRNGMPLARSHAEDEDDDTHDNEHDRIYSFSEHGSFDQRHFSWGIRRTQSFDE